MHVGIKYNRTQYIHIHNEIFCMISVSAYIYIYVYIYIFYIISILLDKPAKAQLARHLQAAGCRDVHPETWDAQDFLASPPREQGLFFLKHSLGVKGTGVHLFDYSSLLLRLRELGHKGCQQFIVQRYVWPPALQNGRKWVMRAHALLHGRANGALDLYCHDDILALEYGQPYTEELGLRAAHISNVAKIKHLPKPTLVEDQEVVKQVRRLAEQAFGAVLEHAPRGPYTPKESELCQVFGLDIILDGSGKAWLLEVNDYPAIGSGTMEHVDTAVYTRLVRDVLFLVVAPKLDGADPNAGGWCPLELSGNQNCLRSVTPYMVTSPKYDPLWGPDC